MDKITRHVGLYSFALPIIFCASSYADEPPVQQGRSRWIEEKNTSAAAFDKRLPPVIPGEEISDGKDRMNVWSTSGGVSVQQPPAPPAAAQQGNNQAGVNNGINGLGPVGVIVDGRPAGQIPSGGNQNGNPNHPY